MRDVLPDKHIKRLFVEREAIDVATHIFVRLRIQPNGQLHFNDAAAKLLLILTQRSLLPLAFDKISDPSRQLGKIVYNDSISTVELALPQEFCSRSEGLTHLLTLLGSPAEYNYAARYWVEAIELPKSFVERYKGPRFGVHGIRQIFGADSRPLLGIIIRRSAGTSREEISAAVSEAVLGGADFIVDDLLLVDPPGEMAFLERVKHFSALCNTLSRSTGRRCAYFANIGGGIGQAYRWTKYAIDAGVNGLVVNSFTMGIGTVEVIASLSNGRVPLICTNMGSGLLSRGTFASGQGQVVDGMSEGVVAKLSRIAGADAVHSGTSASDCFGSEAWGPSVRALQTPLFHIAESMCVAEGDITVANLWDNIKSLGQNMLVEAATGIYNAPNGPRSGANSFRLLLDHLSPDMGSAEANEEIKRLANHHKVLRQTLDAFRWVPHNT